VLWIRRNVPEPEEWQGAAEKSSADAPTFADLFRGSVRRTSILTLLVCALSLSGHWAFMFWYTQQLRSLPDVTSLAPVEIEHLVSKVVWLLMFSSIVGNFLAAVLARKLKYRRAIALLCLAYFLSIVITYGVPRDHTSLWWGVAAIGICQGLFALFTMYLPPLFPTLLRTTGAGFCYNIGRIAAGVGTVVFGLFAKVGDYRLAIFFAGFLFVPAAAIAWILPELADEQAASKSNR
jgi:MFS family permease